MLQADYHFLLGSLARKSFRIRWRSDHHVQVSWLWQLSRCWLTFCDDFMSEFLIRFRVQPRIHVWVQLLEALRVGVRLHRWLLLHVKLRIIRVFGSLLGHLIDLHLP